jgi:hypothetical protein
MSQAQYITNCLAQHNRPEAIRNAWKTVNALEDRIIDFCKQFGARPTIIVCDEPTMKKLEYDFKTAMGHFQRGLISRDEPSSFLGLEVYMLERITGAKLLRKKAPLLMHSWPRKELAASTDFLDDYLQLNWISHCKRP